VDSSSVPSVSLGLGGAVTLIGVSFGWLWRCMAADVPDRATGGAKLFEGAMGLILTWNRLSRSGAGSSSIGSDGSAAGSRGSNLTAGREILDDEGFVETIGSRGLALACGANSRVSENRGETGLVAVLRYTSQGALTSKRFCFHTNRGSLRGAGW
jgi:hypothetical protein